MHLRSRVLVAAFVALLTVGGSAIAASPKLPVHDGIGGPFSAPSSLGRVFHSSELHGKVAFLFFGYTSCPDVCPATLAHLRSVLEPLGPEAERVGVVLVSVDPEVDTAEHLRKYLARFDPAYIGLTGTREQVDRIVRLFKASYERSHGVKVSTEHHRAETFTDETYLYAHSQQIYLLDKAGRTRGLFFTGSPADEMRAAVRSLLEEEAPDESAEAEGPEEDEP